METFEWTGFYLEYTPDADEDENAVAVYSAGEENDSIREWDDLETARSDIDADERFPMTEAEWQSFWDWVEQKLTQSGPGID